MARQADGSRWRASDLGRPRSREQALLDRLAQTAEPRVAGWAAAHRDSVRDSEELLAALEQLRTDGSPLARSLAATIWLAWREEDD